MDVKKIVTGNFVTAKLSGDFLGDEVAKVEKECDSIFTNLHKRVNFPIFDFEEVTAISARAFRYLLKLHKKFGYVLIYQTQEEVYNSFSRAGMLDFLDVFRVPRDASEIQGLEDIINAASQSTVYTLDDERILKLFDKVTGNYRINHVANYEWRHCLASLKLGVPCALPLELIKVGDNYGIIYEKLGRNFAYKLAEEPENFEKYAQQWVDLAKYVTSIEVNPMVDNLSDMKLVVEDIKRHARDSYEKQDIIGEDELKLVDQIFDSIPDRKTYCHGDNHIGNVLCDDEGGLHYIDFPYSGYGHPIFDMITSHMLFAGGYEAEDDKKNEQAYFPQILYTGKQCRYLWDVFSKGLIGSDDPKILKETEDKLTAIEACCNIFLGLLYNVLYDNPDQFMQFVLAESKRVMTEHVNNGNPTLSW